MVTVFTSAQREVKNSRRTGMSQSCFFGDEIGHTKSLRFGCIRLFDEVISELVRDISRSVPFLCYSKKKVLLFLLARSLNRLNCVTHEIR